jgi:hypothetical protein
MTYLPYMTGHNAYASINGGPLTVAGRGWFHRDCWVWLDLRGGKVINTDLPISEWKIEFKDDADAVYFKLKYRT